MLAFEIFVDGEKTAIAGTRDWVVMTVALSAVRRQGDASSADDLSLQIGGMEGSEDPDHSYHVRWAAPVLAVGSEILVRIVDSDHTDLPKKRYLSGRHIQESPFTDEEMREMRYQQYLALKSEFERRSIE